MIDAFGENALIDGPEDVVHSRDERIARIMRQHSVAKGNVVVLVVIHAGSREKGLRRTMRKRKDVLLYLAVEL